MVHDFARVQLKKLWSSYNLVSILADVSSNIHFEK